MARYLFIVSRRDPGLLAFLRERFAGDANVEVILDRRAEPAPPSRRPAVEHRTRPDVDEEIRARGYAVLTLE
ncbi:MAG TPA: hypothetical protein VGD07_19665 [Methylomirabilota bacterium]|jgi:hypothetical protein